MNKPEVTFVGIGAVIGIGVGYALGIYFDAMVIAVTFGGGLGIVIGGILGVMEKMRRKRKDQQ